MRIDRAHYVAAAMQVENRPVSRRSRRRYPFGPHVADAHRFAGHVRCDAFADLLHPTAHLADGGIRISWLRLDDVEYLGELRASHDSFPFASVSYQRVIPHSRFTSVRPVPDGRKKGGERRRSVRGRWTSALVAVRSCAQGGARVFGMRSVAMSSAHGRPS